MEITNNRNKLPSVSINADGYPVLPAVKCDPENDLSKEVLANCGDAGKFFGFMVGNLSYVSERRAVAFRKNKDYPLVTLMRAYSECTVVNYIAVLVAVAGLRMETDWDDTTMLTIAKTIADTPEARRLPFAYIVKFFEWMVQGHNKLYKRDLPNIMETFQCFAKTAIAEVEQLHDEKLRLEYEQQKAREHKENPPITADEFRRQMGIPEGTPISEVFRMLPGNGDNDVPL